MKIITGKFKNRKIIFSERKGGIIKPYTQFAKKVVFNILESNGIFTERRNGEGIIKNAMVADLFAGSGSMGIEAISRGAQGVIFIDKNVRANKMIQRTLESLRIESQKVKVRPWNALSLPYMEMKFDLIFVDPPYRMDIGNKCLEEINKKCWLNDEGVCVLRICKRNNQKLVEGYELLKRKEHGEHIILFLGKTK